MIKTVNLQKIFKTEEVGHSCKYPWLIFVV